MMRFTIMGCGSSGGVPRFGGLDGQGDWGACDPTNPKNTRTRCALLVEKFEGQKHARICIDAGPDFRAQMLRHQVPMLDALVLTHEHADHIHGIDDMRQFVNLQTMEAIKKRSEQGIETTKADYFKMVEDARIDCFAGLSCHGEMMRRFDYLFTQIEGSAYPPIMRLRKIETQFEIEGITFEPFAVPHGSIEAFGFHIEGLVYLPDVFDLTPAARDAIKGCKVLIVDCLQFRDHGTHANFEKTMRWIEELKPERAVLTNLHNSLDFQHLDDITPQNVTPAFDGMVIEI